MIDREGHDGAVGVGLIRIVQRARVPGDDVAAAGERRVVDVEVPVRDIARIEREAEQALLLVPAVVRRRGDRGDVEEGSREERVPLDDADRSVLLQDEDARGVVRRRRYEEGPAEAGGDEDGGEGQ